MEETFYENQYKVRLLSMVNPTERVVFDVTPILAVSAPVEYGQVMPIHMPGAQQVYKNTPPRTFTITATLVSRTVEEATINQDRHHQLLTWRYPNFGLPDVGRYNAVSPTANKERTDMQEALDQPNNEGSRRMTDVVERTIASKMQKVQEEALRRINGDGLIPGLNFNPHTSNANNLGAPPAVLYLYAYSGPNNDDRTMPSKNINRVPVVLTHYEMTYPDTVDYIPTINNEPWPIKTEITLTLVEDHSPRELERFSLSQFKSGQLRGF